jgi:hypothetical protein
MAEAIAEAETEGAMDDFEDMDHMHPEDAQGS